MITRDQTSLNEEEAQEVVRLRASVVYTAIKHEGGEELARSAASLWWSGLAAGLGIFLSVVAMAVLRQYVGQEGAAGAIIHLGYTVGFMVVILGRLQLFTENTITAVIPLLSYRNRRTFYRTARLWGIVFFANMVGVFVAAAATLYLHIFPDSITAHMLELSHHYIQRSAWEFFAHGIPAGFIVAALVWMLPSSQNIEFAVILMMTYVISAAGLTHVVAGAGEVFLMMLRGDISFSDSVLHAILPTFCGNVIGGTVLFALLAYAQVRGEV